MGSPRIPDEIKLLYQDIWLQARREGRNLTTFQVTQAVSQLLDQKGLSKARLPKKRRTQQFVKEVREQYEVIPDEEKRQDLPWHLGALKDNPIPPEALPAVLEAYVYSHEHLNHEFTVRDAQWVARIYRLYKNVGKVGKSTSRAMGLAQIELLARLTGGKWGESEEILNLYEDYTGKKISPKRRERILREGKQWLSPKQTEAVAKRIKDIVKRGGKS